MSFTCPACEKPNQTNKQYILSSARGQNKTWMKCSSCRSYFITEDYENTNEVAHAHNTSYGTVGSGVELTGIKKRLYTTVLEIAKRHSTNSSDQSWLDTGCSFGGLIELVKDNGYNTFGIDIIPEAVKHLSSKGFNVQVADSIGQLDPAKKFDVISALDCHYYWPQQRTEFSLIKNYLDKNGLLIMKTANKSWLVTLGLFVRSLNKSFGNKMIARALNDHRFSMPLDSLLTTLKAQGYQIEEVNIRNAYFSNNTKTLVKMGFYLGHMIYTLTGILIAPGAIVVAHKQS